ncbi:hypothetical protein CDAR_403271 [Caerostris darwini]|uniref:Uncharacterized protein n=1 Tax=Caerostris darwini TaxID=1538125 RepID=A0AAV4S796_9ARAC|nr:hypothetical protein CDAR_403271 [Caerostris darwini]
MVLFVVSWCRYNKQWIPNQITFISTNDLHESTIRVVLTTLTAFTYEDVIENWSLPISCFQKRKFQLDTIYLAHYDVHYFIAKTLYKAFRKTNNVECVVIGIEEELTFKYLKNLLFRIRKQFLGAWSNERACNQAESLKIVQPVNYL